MLMLICGILTMLLGVGLGGMALELTMRTIKRHIDGQRATEALTLHQRMQGQG